MLLCTIIQTNAVLTFQDLVMTIKTRFSREAQSGLRYPTAFPSQTLAACLGPQVELSLLHIRQSSFSDFPQIPLSKHYVFHVGLASLRKHVILTVEYLFSSKNDCNLP